MTDGICSFPIDSRFQLLASTVTERNHGEYADTLWLFSGIRRAKLTGNIGKSESDRPYSLFTVYVFLRAIVSFR